MPRAKPATNGAVDRQLAARFETEREVLKGQVARLQKEKAAVAALADPVWKELGEVKKALEAALEYRQKLEAQLRALQEAQGLAEASLEVMTQERNEAQEAQVELRRINQGLAGDLEHARKETGTAAEVADLKAANNTLRCNLYAALNGPDLVKASVERVIRQRDLAQAEVAELRLSNAELERANTSLRQAVPPGPLPSMEGERCAALERVIVALAERLI